MRIKLKIINDGPNESYEFNSYSDAIVFLQKRDKMITVDLNKSTASKELKKVAKKSGFAKVKDKLVKKLKIK